jgi:hypothetical protein
MTETCTLTVSKTNVSTTAKELWEEEEETIGLKRARKGDIQGSDCEGL